MSTRHEKERQRAAQEKYQAVLSQLLKDEDNKYCVDCDAKGPRWASWNLGIFLCIRCAGIHRNLGVHISKVKSVNLDTWTAEQLAMLMEMGNSRARAVYEANIPDNFRRPQTDSALEAFIRAKYEHKRYIAREWVQPKPTVPKQVKKEVRELLDDEKPEKKKTRGRPSSMIQLNAPSQKVESKEVTETTAQPLKEIAKETKKSSHADDLLNLSSPGESSANNANLLDDFLGSSGASTANAAPAAPINAVQSQTSGQTPTNTANSSQQAFQQNGAFDDSLFTSASSDAKSGNDKTTKESIMALYGSSTPQQQNIFGVPGGMYMPAQGINVQPTMPANNSMAVQQGMTGMVNPGLVGMPQPGLYQLNATGMMATAPGSNSMPAAAGMMMQPPQMGMYAATQAQPQMNQMNMQQMQHQLAAMRLNTSNVIPPTGQMGVRPPVGAPANQASNPWGMQPTSGQTLSTNLWQ
ncbi:stromal membrane-associated protein 1 isoform X3 [Octopus bimaculoides]|uniref:stromal membrane-associated protein 1 isoform X3 n=1 Tax=Octopus bimaculoides TaxID=37653 RepID=UPI00071DBE64|nr:stromal membrane-associated protein 1 isoform X3 [Octopus bimaculoides]|eukprot:XP_014777298.1 PREDICTED: stromal membrane-associated protein 1-like isoform X4 [Octopus bimaculoides]